VVTGQQLIAFGKESPSLSERSLILIKPDGVRRGLVGEVISRIEDKGLQIVALELRTLDLGIAREHYAEHEGKPFYARLQPDLLIGFSRRFRRCIFLLSGQHQFRWKVKGLGNVSSFGMSYSPRCNASLPD
jgi:hypothetical protein